MKVVQNIDNPEYQSKVLYLQALIKYEQDDCRLAKDLMKQAAPDDPDTWVNEGCILMKDEKYEDAIPKFESAIGKKGYRADLSYNIALCYYRLKRFGECLREIGKIIEKGVRDHPELGVGSNEEGENIISIGNTQVLKESALIEAFNLKIAIEFHMKNLPAAKEALMDMPPRNEDELDPVTLHNKALIYMEEEPQKGFDKLNFLLNNPPFPPETFSNLVLLYCKYN